MGLLSLQRLERLEYFGHQHWLITAFGRHLDRGDSSTF
jgi:hypothetical protein